MAQFKKGEKTVKKIILIVVLVAFCSALSACGRTKKLLFWNKDTKESPAFVDEKNPLAVPPEYDIRPQVTSKTDE